MTKNLRQDKQLLIREFIDSGLSMNKWCEIKQIPLSTFSGWVRKETKKTYESASPKFVELTSKSATSGTGFTIAIGSSIIEVDINTDLNLVAKLIKAVNQENV